MFETHDHAEIPLHPEFRDSGERLWAYVRTRLHVPWLHVVYGRTHEEDGEPVTLREMMFLSEVQQLEQLRQMPRLSIVSVDLMSPGHLNGTGRWQLAVKGDGGIKFLAVLPFLFAAALFPSDQV